MSDILIRKTRRAGHITLTRPQALNALSHEMCLAIEAALDRWAGDPDIALVIIDGEGERAFCAGGDIAQIHAAGAAGDMTAGRDFWRDEYRLNLKLATYPRPIVGFLHGFVMGGGVGLGGHLSHRVVSESSQIAMPECGIGFVPDVGGSLLLARAPGRLGEYLGLTAARMGPGDAIHAGFADLFVPQQGWTALKERLAESGTLAALSDAATTPPDSPLAAQQPRIDRLFAAPDLGGIIDALRDATDAPGPAALKAVSRNAPLSMATTLEMLRRLRAGNAGLAEALRQEYRVSHRILEHGDFLEGVRAQIIDKDRTPVWRVTASDLGRAGVEALLAPLGEDELAL